MNTVNGLTNYQSQSEVKNTKQTDKVKQGMGKNDNKDAQVSTNQDAVVYEKTEVSKTPANYNKEGRRIDAKTIEAMKRESEMQYTQMIETVRRMIARQSKEAGGIPKEFDFFNKIPKTIEELNASKGYEGTEKIDSFEDHLGEDLNDPNSYYSAEKTAERIVNFAKSISGGDIKKYELLKGAIEDGFKAASSYFDKMPEITGKTHELVMKGFDEWAGKDEKAEDATPEAKATQASAL